MTRRTWAIAVALLLAFTAAGAIAVQALSQNAPQRPVVPTTESGALAHVDAARAQAAAWREDAALVHVLATEGPHLHGEVDPPFTWDTSGDAYVGNGQALVWTFTFRSPAAWDRAFWVSIGGDGSLLYARELRDRWTSCCTYVGFPPAADASHAPHDEGHASHDATTTSEYRVPEVRASVDAPAAVAAVADHPAFAEFALDHPVHQARLMLIPTGENASGWVVSYETASGFMAHALVDAETGKVLESGGWPRPEPCCPAPPAPPEPPMHTPVPEEPCCRPPDHHATYTGRLDAYGSYDISFPIGSALWLDHARVTFALEDGLPHERYLLTLYDGAGRVVAKAEGTGVLELQVASVPVSGTYNAYVHRVSDLGYGMEPPLRRTSVEAVVDVVYAELPPERGTVFTYHGEAWGGEQWMELRAEGPGWTPMRPDVLTLSWESRLPAQPLELVLVDEWGNEVASASGDPLALGWQSVTLEAPAGTPYMAALVRAPHTTVSIIPFTLDVVYAIEDPHDARAMPAHPYH